MVSGGSLCFTDAENGLFNLLIKKIEQYRNGNLVMMGDFKAVMDLERDKSKQGTLQSVIPEIFRLWLQERGFIDTWRVQYPEKEQYTFHSIRHDSFSFIDYIFLATDTSVSMTKAQIGISLLRSLSYKHRVCTK